MATKTVKKAKVVKKSSKPTVTRHRPMPRKDVELTKPQRQGEAMMRDAESGPPRRKDSGGRKKKSLAYRAKSKIGRKHKILRPATYLTVGLLVGVREGVKWTAIGAGKASQWSGKRLVAKARRDAHYRKWVPDTPRPAGTRWFQRVESLECCGRHFHSVEGLNHHAVTEHRGEAKVWRAPRPKIQQGHRRTTEGKVIVRPVGAGGGRHRARHNLPSFRRVDAIIAAHRDHLTKIGDAVMATSNAAAALRRAAKEFGESPKPETLADLAEQCVGMERALGEWADAVADWGRMLTREADVGDRRGANIDPALVRPFTRSIQENLGLAGRDFTRFIAAFQEFYRPEIAAARQKKTPNLDLSKTG
jgi:hypothetical protein